MKLGQEATVTFEDGETQSGVIEEYHEHGWSSSGGASSIRVALDIRGNAEHSAEEPEFLRSASSADLGSQGVLTPTQKGAVLNALHDPKMIHAVRLLEDCVREGKTDWGEVLAAGVSTGLAEETLDAARLVLAGIGSDAFAKPVAEAPQNGGVTP